MSDSKYDDDDKTYSMPEPKFSPRSGKGAFALNFSNSNDAKGGDNGRDEGVQEDEILVVFDLPDGSQSDNKFKFGNTVEYLKSYIEGEFGIPMKSQILRYQGKVMMDPLSMLDFDVKGKRLLFVISCCCKLINLILLGHREMVIKVEGNLPAGSKK